MDKTAELNRFCTSQRTSAEGADPIDKIKIMRYYIKFHLKNKNKKEAKKLEKKPKTSYQ